jgi:hypothetical protein
MAGRKRTLSVGGAVVSGVLTSERVYFKGLAKALEMVIGRAKLGEHHEGAANVARERSGEEGVSEQKIPTRKSGRLGPPKRSSSESSEATTGAKDRATSTSET